MKNAKEKGAAIINVDKDLDNYLQKGLFKEKIDKANHVLKTVGIPDFPANIEEEPIKRKGANKARR